MLGSLVIHTVVVTVAFILVRHHALGVADKTVVVVSMSFEAPAETTPPAVVQQPENILPNAPSPAPDIPKSFPPDQVAAIPPLATEPVPPPLLKTPSLAAVLPPLSRRPAPAAHTQTDHKPISPTVPQAALPLTLMPHVLVPAQPVAGLDGRCQPEYPMSALRRGQQGLVIVRVTVSAQGQVMAASLAQSSGTPALDNAALAKVMHDCRFLPARRDGLPIEGFALQPMKFEIEG